MITTSDTAVASTRYNCQIYWRSSYDLLDTDDSSLYRYSSVSSMYLCLRWLQTRCQWLLTYISLECEYKSTSLACYLLCITMLVHYYLLLQYGLSTCQCSILWLRQSSVTPQNAKFHTFFIDRGIYFESVIQEHSYCITFMVEYWLDQFIIGTLIIPMLSQNVCKVVFRFNVQHVDISSGNHTSDKVEW